MPSRDIVVIGGSAGAVEGTLRLVRELPPEAPMTLFITIHVPPNAPSVLPRLLGRASGRRAVHPVDGDPIEPGAIYVAPPDRHLLIKRGRVRTVMGPRQNSLRPAVDPMFRSAARTYGARVVGVVLSGNLDDGTSGLALVKREGGIAVVQSPEDALYSGMPASAIAHVDVDHVLPLAEIAGCLGALARQRVPDAEEGMSRSEGGSEGGSEGAEEPDEIELDHQELERLATMGEASGFTCPECHGALWESGDDEQLRFRCRVGHKYTPEGLLAEQGTSVEAALRMALRALEENREMARRVSDRHARGQNQRMSDVYTRRAAVLEGQATAIRGAIDGAGHGRAAVAHRE